MPTIIKIDVLHDLANRRVALRMGSEESGSHTLVVSPEQAREIAASIESAASMAEGMLGLSGGRHASN